MSQAPPPYAPHAPLRQPPAPSGNGLGIAGFIVSIVGMVLCMGAICPIGAILSFFAVFKKPRGFALAGLIIGVLGTILWAVLWVLLVASMNSAWNNTWSNFNIYAAQTEIDGYYFSNNALPDDAKGNQLVAIHTDRWGSPYRYRVVDAQNYEIISDGQDMQPGTTDDIVQSFPAQSPWGGGGVGGFGGLTGDAAFEEAHARVEQTFRDEYEAPAWHEVEQVLGDTYRDEWGNVIRYNAGDGRAYELRSNGPDGIPQTDDDVVRDYILGETTQDPDEAADAAAETLRNAADALNEAADDAAQDP